MNDKSSSKDSLIEQIIKDEQLSCRLLSGLSFEGMAIHDRLNTIVVNNSFLSLFGYDNSNEVIGKNLRDLTIHPDDHSIIPQKMKKKVSGKFEAIAVRKDGSTFIAEIEAQDFQIYGENFRAVAFRDITERKKNEDELRELIATKDKFFSIISHDLRDPFHAILGYANLLKQRLPSMSDEDRDVVINTLVDSTKQTHKLLDNLLTWSRTQQKSIRFQPNTHDLGVLVYDTILESMPKASQKNIDILTSFEKDLSVFADKTMLQLCTRNLLTNALKFTSESGTITVKTYKYNSWVCIAVKDTGRGMTRETSENIFNIAVKVSTTGTDGETGSGLGMILVKEFMDMHQGEITINSEPGNGTEIVLKFPDKQV